MSGVWFKLLIDSDDAAFDEYPGTELARILRDVADLVDETEPDNRWRKLRDVNGNHVGDFTYMHKDNDHDE